jgi:hypothetical protein
MLLPLLLPPVMKIIFAIQFDLSLLTPYSSIRHFSFSPPYERGLYNNVVQDFSPADTADLKICTTEMH